MPLPGSQRPTLQRAGSCRVVSAASISLARRRLRVGCFLGSWALGSEYLRLCGRCSPICFAK